MPLPMTETGVPSQEPVKASMLRTALTWRASSRKVSAMYLARRGSPGRRQAGAKIPGRGFKMGRGHEELLTRIFHEVKHAFFGCF